MLHTQQSSNNQVKNLSQSFSGIWVALVTPFKNGMVDHAALTDLARHIVAAGVAGLVVCGSTGEAAALSEDEALEVLHTVIAAVPTCPLIMGLAGNNMVDVLRRQHQIMQRPICGLLVTAPYYIRPSQAGLMAFFTALADASSVPIVLYNIPYRTGVAIELATFRTLAQHPRIVAVKDCGGDSTLTMQLIADAQLAVLVGEDQHMLSGLCLGAAGAITASAHIRPDLFVRLAALVREDKLNEARQIFYQLLPLIDMLFTEPNPAPVKAALAQMGWMTDELRMPLQRASAALQERLANQLSWLAKISN